MLITQEVLQSSANLGSIMFEDATLLRRARRDLQSYVALADSRLEQLLVQRRSSVDPWGDLAKGMANDSPAKVPEVVVVEYQPEPSKRGRRDIYF